MEPLSYVPPAAYRQAAPALPVHPALAPQAPQPPLTAPRRQQGVEIAAQVLPIFFSLLQQGWISRQGAVEQWRMRYSECSDSKSVSQAWHERGSPDVSISPGLLEPLHASCSGGTYSSLMVRLASTADLDECE